MASTICVASGKGGTGKTSVSSGLACCLAGLGYKVIVLDADIGLRNLDLALGLNERAIFDFSDVILERATLKQALVAHHSISNLHLLAAPFGTELPDITKEQMATLMQEVNKLCDFCIMDCPAGIGSWLDIIASVSDRAIMVATPDNASLRDAGITRKFLKVRGVSDIRLVLNRVRPKLINKMRAVNIDDAIDFTGIQLIGIVPEDQTVIACANHGEPVVFHMNSYAAKAYRNIARRIIGENIPLMRIPRKTV